MGERLAVWQDFADAVIAEADRRCNDNYGDAGFAKAYVSEGLSTLYIGGGTPSLMPNNDLRRLVAGLMPVVGNISEFTIEVNPDDVTEEKARLWSECGVNRISMGVQTLDNELLSTIGRRHDSETALRAYGILRPWFDNISLDIMFGLPGQSLKTLKSTIDQLISLAPEHLSAYSLMYEERTALTVLRDAGRVSEVSEEDSCTMFALISDSFAQAGYEQYEISNYARPGYRSVHNSLYWQGKPYIGLGPGAHSYDGERKRIANIPDLKKYTDYWLQGTEGPVSEIEILTLHELCEEMIMTRLRTREGLFLPEFASRFGQDQLNRLLKLSQRWLRSGELLISEDSLSLSRTGIFISDEIISSLF